MTPPACRASWCFALTAATCAACLVRNARWRLRRPHDQVCSTEVGVVVRTCRRSRQRVARSGTCSYPATWATSQMSASIAFVMRTSALQRLAARAGAKFGVGNRCIGAGRPSFGWAARAIPDDAPSSSLTRYLRRNCGCAERPVWSGFATFETHADAAPGRREPNDRCWRSRPHAPDPLLSFRPSNSLPHSSRSTCLMSKHFPR